MKKLCTFLLIVFFSVFVNAQDTGTKVVYSNSVVAKITSLKMTITQVKELKTINWQDVKSVFENNQPEDKIELSFELDLKDSKNKIKSEMTIGGQVKDLNSLIITSRKMIKAIIKISKNN